MDSSAYSERRKYPRTLLEVAVSLCCTTQDGNSHLFSVYDISLSGMALHSDSIQPNVGDTLCLCLSKRRDNCSREHVIEATVVHCQHDHIGVQFDTVGIHILKDIQRLLRGAYSF